MKNSVYVKLPKSWDMVSAGSKEDLVSQIQDVSIAVSDLFSSYFASDTFEALSKQEKMNVTSRYRCIIEILNSCLLSAFAEDRIEYILVKDALYEDLSDLTAYINSIQELDEVFFALLSNDEGFDLSPDGYLNVNIVNTKRMLFDLYTDTLRTVVRENFKEIDKLTT